MKYWRGKYVIVFPGNRVRFHSCLVCGRKLTFGTESSESGIGPECRSRDDAEAQKENRLKDERERYRREVLDPGFRIE